MKNLARHGLSTFQRNIVIGGFQVRMTRQCHFGIPESAVKLQPTTSNPNVKAILPPLRHRGEHCVETGLRLG